MANVLIKIIFVIVLVIMITLNGCKDENVLSTRIEKDTIYVTDIKSFVIDKVIFPQNPKVGDYLKITFKNKPIDIYVNDLRISYLQTDYESVNGDTVISFWPVLPKMEVLMFTVGLANYNTYTFGSASKWIKTEYEVVNSVKVIKNDENPVVPNLLYPPILMHGNPRFSLEEKGDTIIIGVGFNVHDEAGERMYWKFLGRGTELPKFIEHTRYWNTSDGSVAGTKYYADTLKKGVIKIDKWNENGVYSGIVYSELEPFSSDRYMRPRTMFWVKRN